MKTHGLLVLLAVVLAFALPAATSAADDQGGCGAEECIGSTPVVPSLDPEWSANFVPPVEPRVRALAPCIQTDVVVYTPTDWLRFAQSMRYDMSQCASYYVSIPPLASDKTKPRGPNQAPLIRALGANFHAVNEINVSATTSWAKWVAEPNTNRTWYDAGVEARRRMESPTEGGFDVAAGDIWAVNELSSAVRQGTGLSRQNMRDLVHGLYDGGSGPPVKGIVWTSGIGQGTAYLDTYRTNVKNWLGDAGFWTDMSQYVRFFSQEAYGAVDNWAVPGTTLQERLTPTADYLEHYRNFASAGAYDPANAAAAYLETADAPIGNAAWSSAAYDWPSPAVDYTLAANYGAAQVSAFRHEQDTRPSQSFGFAWSPSNPGLATADYNAKTLFILNRIAAAIHASDRPSAEPGLAACGTELSWCSGDLEGASFNTAWRLFRDWAAPTASPSQGVAEANSPTSLPLSGFDPDPGTTLTYSIVSQPVHGTATSDGGAAAVYTAEAGYSGPDSFSFKVSDGVLSSKEATVDVTVYGLPEGGAFVIGDRSASGMVTFWSPFWWLANGLTGGPAPASFKGFANSPGETWSASPGFGHPPATVPEWMGVVVASKLEKNGPTITGDHKGMVVVHVGVYEPALTGTGVVVATID